MHTQTNNTHDATQYTPNPTHTHTHSTTHVKEVSGHVTAVAAFVPVSSLQTVITGVAGQRAVRTVTVRTDPRKVSLKPT